MLERWGGGLELFVQAPTQTAVDLARLRRRAGEKSPIPPTVTDDARRLVFALLMEQRGALASLRAQQQHARKGFKFAGYFRFLCLTFLSTSPGQHGSRLEWDCCISLSICFHRDLFYLSVWGHRHSEGDFATPSFSRGTNSTVHTNKLPPLLFILTTDPSTC